MGFTAGIVAVTLATGAPAGMQNAADAASSMQVNSVWDFILKGGLMMIPIGLCSLIGLALVVERLSSLRRRVVIPPDFLPGLKKLLHHDAQDQAKALAYCRDNGSPVANVFAAGIKRLGSSLELVEKHIQEAGEREVIKLRRFVRTLSVIASIAPLLGLLGTILGMIKAFQTVAISADSLGRAEMLAGGIYEAMITTAGGLTVAIPVLVLYHYITSKIDNLVVEIDQMTVDFIDEYAGGDPMRAAAAAARAAPGPKAPSNEAAAKPRPAAATADQRGAA